MASSASKSTSKPIACHRIVPALKPAIHMALAVALPILLLVPQPVLAQPANVDPQQVKAALLMKFLPFIDWPQNAFPNAKAPIEIAVLGNDPVLLNTLVDLAKGAQINGRPVQVRQINDVGKAAGAHVVFITQGEKGNLAAILAALQNRNVLSVGDSDGFAQGGVIVNFVIDKQGRVGVEFNPKAAARQGIDVSQLVGVGNIVN